MILENIFIYELVLSLIKDKCELTTKHEVNIIQDDYKPNKYDELDKCFILNNELIEYEKVFHIFNFIIFLTNQHSLYVFRKQLH